jgi:hypothetical protein
VPAPLRRTLRTGTATVRHGCRLGRDPATRRGRPRSPAVGPVRPPRPALPSPTVVPVVVRPGAPFPRGVPGPTGAPFTPVPRSSPVPAGAAVPHGGPGRRARRRRPPRRRRSMHRRLRPPVRWRRRLSSGPGRGRSHRATPARRLALSTKSNELVASSTRSAQVVDGSGHAGSLGARRLGDREDSGGPSAGHPPDDRKRSARCAERRGGLPARHRDARGRRPGPAAAGSRGRLPRLTLT